MVSDVEEQCGDIYPCRRDDHFEASQGFFIETSAVLLRPLCKGGVNRPRNIFKSYAFHAITISQP